MIWLWREAATSARRAPRSPTPATADLTRVELDRRARGERTPVSGYTGYKKHLRVDHARHEFSCRTIRGSYINGIEGFWGYARTSVVSPLRGLWRTMPLPWADAHGQLCGAASPLGAGHASCPSQLLRSELAAASRFTPSYAGSLSKVRQGLLKSTMSPNGCNGCLRSIRFATTRRRRGAGSTGLGELPGCVDIARAKVRITRVTPLVFGKVAVVRVDDPRQLLAEQLRDQAERVPQ